MSLVTHTFTGGHPLCEHEYSRNETRLEDAEKMSLRIPGHQPSSQSFEDTLLEVVAIRKAQASGLQESQESRLSRLSSHGSRQETYGSGAKSTSSRGAMNFDKVQSFVGVGSLGMLYHLPR